MRHNHRYCIIIMYIMNILVTINIIVRRYIYIYIYIYIYDYNYYPIAEYFVETNT